MIYVLIYIAIALMWAAILAFEVTKIKRKKIETAEQFRVLALMGIFWPLSIISVLTMWVDGE